MTGERDQESHLPAHDGMVGAGVKFQRPPRPFPQGHENGSSPAQQVLSLAQYLDGLMGKAEGMDCSCGGSFGGIFLSS